MSTQVTSLDTLDHGSVSLLTGIQWLDTADNDAAKEFVKKEGVSKPVVIDIVKHDECVQKGVASLNGIKAKGLYCAAQLYAYMQNLAGIYLENTDAAKADAWIVVEQIQDKFWLCLIADGQIVQESESLLDAEQVKEEAEELQNYAMTMDLTLQFVGSGVVVFNPQSSVVVSFEEIFRRLSSEELKRLKIASDQKQTLMAAAALIGGVFLIGWQFGPALGLYSTGPSPEEIRQQQEQSAIAILEAHYSAYLAKPSLNPVLTASFSQLERRNVFDSPWPLHRLNCDFDLSNCQVTYKNPNNIRVDHIKRFLKKRCDEYSVTAQGAAANCGFSFNASQIGSTGTEAGRNVHDLTDYLMSFSDVGFSTEISTPAQSSIPGAELAPIERFKREGAWKISGSYIDAVNVSRYIPNVEWAKPRSLIITDDSSTSNLALTIEGTYVIQ